MQPEFACTLSMHNHAYMSVATYCFFFQCAKVSHPKGSGFWNVFVYMQLYNLLQDEAKAEVAEARRR